MDRKMAFILFLAFHISGCVAWNTGLPPVDPPGRKILPSPKVASERPTLSWKGLEGEGITETSYQLLVFKYDGLKRVYVYERSDIIGTSHTIEKPLEPHTRYYWKVRPVYKKDGTEFADEWNGYSFFFAVPPILGFSSGDYSFDIP